MTGNTFFDGQVTVNDKALKFRRIHPETAADALEDAPVLVFLHEGLGCIDMWKTFPEELCVAVGLNGLVYDRLGYGDSEVSEAPFSVDYLKQEALESLPKLLKQLDIDKTILVGHSDGGSIALIAGAEWKQEEQPEIKGVISEAAHIYVEPVTIKGIREAVKNYETRGLKERLIRYHGEKTDAVFHRWAAIWLSEEFLSFNLEALIPHISCPLLLLQGNEDEYATPMHLMRIYELALEKPKKKRPFPIKAELVTGAAHTPHLQAKKDVLEQAVRFIRLIHSKRT